MLRSLTSLKLQFDFAYLCLVELLVQFLAFIGEYVFTNAHAHDLKQKQQREVLYKKGVLKNVVKFTGKLMRWSVFFNKVAGFRLKRDSNTGEPYPKQIQSDSQ